MRALYLSLVAILLFAAAPTVFASHIGGQPPNIGHSYTIEITGSGVSTGPQISPQQVSIGLKVMDRISGLLESNSI